MAIRGHVRSRQHRTGLVLLGLVIGLALLLGGCATAGTTTWQSIGPDAHSITALAVEPGQTLTLFAGSAGQGLFRSLDGGNSWAADNTGLSPSATINSIVVDQAQSGLLYLGTNTGVFLSNDNGDHWQGASQGLSPGAAGAVTALLLSPDDPATLYAGTAQRGVYISQDGAQSWRASAQGLSAGAAVHALLAVAGNRGLLLFAALTGAGVYQSSDGGTNWSSSNSGLPTGLDALSLLAQPSDPGGLYVGTSAGVYRSTDQGASWKAANSGLGQTPPQVFALGVNAQQPSFLYAATSTGVYTSTDDAATWTQVVSGLPAQPVIALAVVGSSSSAGTLYAAAGQVYQYPTVTTTATGLIVTVVIVGVFLLLFFLLFRQQRRLLQTIPLRPPTRPAEPSTSDQQSGTLTAHPKNATSRSPSDSNGRLIAPGEQRASGSDGLPNDEQH